MSILNPSVLGRLDELADAFRRATPFQHVVIDDFLRPEVARGLLEEFPSVEDTSTLVNEFGAPNKKSAIFAVRSIGPTYRQVDDELATPEFARVMSHVTGIPDLLYDPEYLGGGTHENFESAGLDAHVDFNLHSTTGHHRRLNAIVYLNEGWDPAWGGSICLHSNPWDPDRDEVREVAPDFNRCVIFETSEHSWHSVPIVHLPDGQKHRSRKSFAIYMYTRERPAEETAPEHGTIYVQSGLPRHLTEGHRLTADEVADLKHNFARRNRYLQALYDREKKFSAVVEQLKRALREAERRVPIPFCGYARIAGIEAPPHADGWIGERLALTLAPLRPATGVALQLWRNDSPDVPVRYRVAAGGQVAEGEVKNAGMVRIEVRLSRATREPLFVEATFAGCQSPHERGLGADLRPLSFVLDRVELLHE